MRGFLIDFVGKKPCFQLWSERGVYSEYSVAPPAPSIMIHSLLTHRKLRLQGWVALTLVWAAARLLHAQDTARQLAGPDAVSSQLGAEEVAQISALDSARMGLDSMEHWYGLPEAMFTDKQCKITPVITMTNRIAFLPRGDFVVVRCFQCPRRRQAGLKGD